MNRQRVNSALRACAADPVWCESRMYDAKSGNAGAKPLGIFSDFQPTIRFEFISSNTTSEPYELGGAGDTTLTQLVRERETVDV